LSLFLESPARAHSAEACLGQEHPDLGQTPSTKATLRRLGPSAGRGVRAVASRGFSLIELMVVITIIAFAAGLASVSWDSVFPAQRLNSDVRELSSVLQGARVDAIARSIELRVFYDIDNEQYWLEFPRPDAVATRTGTNRETEEIDEELKERLSFTSLSDGIEFVSITIDGEEWRDGQVFVRFDPLGAASEHTILLYQPKFDRHYTIEVLPLTGLIRFHDGVYVRELAQDEDFD